MESSPLLRPAGGYLPYDRYFVRLTRAIVHLLCSKRALRRVAGGIACLSLHPEGGWENVLDFGLVAGSASTVLRAMPAVGRGLGFDEVHSFIPHEPHLLAAAAAAGFRKGSWGHEAILFERAIELGAAPYRKRPTYAEIAAGKRKGYAALALLSGHHGHGGPREDRRNP